MLSNENFSVNTLNTYLNKFGTNFYFMITIVCRIVLCNRTIMFRFVKPQEKQLKYEGVIKLRNQIPLLEMLSNNAIPTRKSRT